ncbi:hypothetical protein ABIE44_003508 [Marmoricola sp. OAE513]|uniref:hypothetical protein n=1 Tax=Marmoricola sp. OAE513 TaxID=2817894 RepID=UPI001AE59336
MSRPDEDALWRDIVDSYGDRPEFPDVVPEQEPVPARPAPEVPHELDAAAWEDEGRFVPPEPPPVPRPRGVRALAWFGLFGIPALMLVMVIAHWSPPSPTGLLMIAWFVGGFGYLVATMNGPRDPDSGWDDGAVL